MRQSPVGPAIRSSLSVVWGAAALVAADAGCARAQGTIAPTAQAPAPAPAPNAPAAPPATWASTINLGAQLDAGFTGAPDRPSDGLNFGRLFDDKDNTVLLNQVQLTATRPINSAATGYDVGFMLQADEGTDARYTHYLGEFNYLTSSRYQFTVLQANVLLHAPWLTPGGIDFKLGQFVTPIGYETIDPSTNPFYSHSYLFNFGPFQHTGLQAIWHYNPTFDFYLQVDTGESTTFDGGDNNSEPAGLVGVGVNNLLNNKLTLLLLSHLGPEDARHLYPNANSLMRYETDLVATYKATDKFTLVTEAQEQHDDLGDDSYGVAQYLEYALTPTLTANFRGEIYRDNGGFFVAAFPGNLDPVRALNGLPNTSFGEGSQTYSEWTWGVTYKPAIPHVALLAFRPEIRWDKSFSGGHPFDAGTGNGTVTLAGDIILGF